MAHPLFQVLGPFVLSLLALAFGKSIAVWVRRILTSEARRERQEHRDFTEAESIRAELRMERDALKKECAELRDELAYFQQRVLALWNEANRCRERDGLPPLPEERMPPAALPPWERH